MTTLTPTYSLVCPDDTFCKEPKLTLKFVWMLLYLQLKSNLVGKFITDRTFVVNANNLNLQKQIFFIVCCSPNNQFIEPVFLVK